MISLSLCAAFVLAGCSIYAEPTDHMVSNRSGETVEVVQVSPGREYSFGEWAPNGAAPLFGFDGCVDVLLIARSKSGREVDRWSGPFCDDDAWVIIAAGATAPP